MRKFLRGLFWTVAFLGVTAAVLRVTVIDVWKVPDDGTKFAISIEPTLTAGDTVLVITRGEPHFGDLVRCTDPDDPTNWVIGRVAGLAGDVVETDSHDLTVANKKYRSEMVCPEEHKVIIHPVSGEEVKLTCDQVEMGGRLHYRGWTYKNTSSPTRSEVGLGKLFLLSDDRSYHFDSRDFGTIAASSCKGRIFFRLWSKAGWQDDKARFSYIR